MGIAYLLHVCDEFVAVTIKDIVYIRWGEVIHAGCLFKKI